MVRPPEDEDTRNEEEPLLSARKVRHNLEDDLRSEERFQEKSILRSRAAKR
jgi:hypothetical protein